MTTSERDDMWIRGLLLLALTGVNANAAPPDERYYMTLFGAQSSPPITSKTHTWATFVRTRVTPDGEVPVAVDTVSWMPATLRIHPFAVRRETGVNLSLDATFAWVASVGSHASYWGPYEIDGDRYAEVLARKAELESGTVKYRAIGALTFKQEVSNCGQSFAHASASDVGKYLYPTPSPGETGTSVLARRYLEVGALRGGGATHPWLLPAVGADRFPAVERRPGERIPRFFR